MSENYKVTVRMQHTTVRDSYEVTLTACGSELINDLMSRAIGRYNATRYFVSYIHPNSPYLLSANRSRYPARGSIVAVFQTCGELMEYVRRQKPTSKCVHLNATLTSKKKQMILQFLYQFFIDCATKLSNVFYLFI